MSAYCPACYDRSRPVADVRPCPQSDEMKPLTAYAFRDPDFSPGGDTHVCIVERGALVKFIGVREVQRAFSGAVFYRRGLWTSFVGVWGRRNGKRLRRFLQERGATVVIERGRPERTRLSLRSTQKARAAVRQLDAKVG